LGNYEQGYFKALLDIYNYTETYGESIKNLKQRKYKFLVNLINYLLKNRAARDLFARCDGNVSVKVSHEKDCEILFIVGEWR
jgi:hypothetical protein